MLYSVFLMAYKATSKNECKAVKKIAFKRGKNLNVKGYFFPGIQGVRRIAIELMRLRQLIG
ncbi:hypothetical protein GCM10020331_083230 [Ectobacillus funiculus]